ESGSDPLRTAAVRQGIHRIPPAITSDEIPPVHGFTSGARCTRHRRGHYHVVLPEAPAASFPRFLDTTLETRAGQSSRKLAFRKTAAVSVDSSGGRHGT